MLHDGTSMIAYAKTFLQRLMVGATNSVLVMVDDKPRHKSALVWQHI